MPFLRISALVLTLLLVPFTVAATAGTPVLVSSPGPLGTLPAQGVADAGSPDSLKGDDQISVSDDGRYSVFGSQSDGLSTADDDRFTNIFRKDRVTGDIVLISRSTAGTGADGYSYGASISDDGTLVAFTSTASNLDPGDTDRGHDVYVRNVPAGTTTLISSGAARDCQDGSDADCGAAAISGNGQFVAYVTEAPVVAADGNAGEDVYRRTVAGTSPVLISQVEASNPARAGNADSWAPSIDDAGAKVAFTTSATDLAAAPAVTDANTATDVYVRTVIGGDIRLVSGVNASQATTLAKGSKRPLISGDGLQVAFATSSNGVDPAAADADNSEDVYLRTLSTNVNALISRANGQAGAKSDAFQSAPLGLSDDGQWILFRANASNLGIPNDGQTRRTGIYVRRYIPSLLGTTIPLSIGPGGPSENAYDGALSGDASRALVLSTTALDTTAHREEGEVYERTVSAPPGAAEVVSRPPGTDPYGAQDSGAFGTGYNGIARHTSADGRYVVFGSDSDGLAPDDDDAVNNVYRRDLRTGVVDLVSRADGAAGAGADDDANAVSISASGNRVAFVSYASNLGATGGSGHVFVRDLAAGTTTLASRADGVAGAEQTASRPEISGDGRRVAYVSDVGGVSHAMVRDLEAGTTVQADRADGAAGAPAPSGVAAVSIDQAGNRVAFTTPAKNLEGPGTDDDAIYDVYVRDLAAGTTRLVSRADGVGGAKATSISYGVELSLDGTHAAFTSASPGLAPEAGPWPANKQQVFVRDLGAGTTRLASRGAGASQTGAGAFSIDGTGDQVAFLADEVGLVDGATDDPTVYVRRMSTGVTTALPSWSPPDPLSQVISADQPSLSGDGRCLLFIAEGVGPIPGLSPDYANAFVQALDGGTCPATDPIVTPPDPPKNDPPKTPPVAPKVTKLKLSHTRFTVAKGATATSAKAGRKKPRTPAGTTIGFTLSTKAAVALTLESKTAGRRSGKSCVKPTRKLAKKKKCDRYVKAGTLKRASVKAGGVKIAFTGRVGKRALKPGAYRLTVVATAGGRSSAPARVAFTVVR